MSRPPPPPAPTHLLRSHSGSISALWISPDNERIYSGDGLGKVVVTSTRSLRPLTVWSPHSDSILGLEEFGNYIITHGRDNKLHVWNRIEESPASTRLGGSAAVPSLPTPTLAYSMDVNALNYCRFSLLQGFPSSKLDDTGESSSPTAFVALPNLVDSSTADVWSIPSCDRLHAAIGQETNTPIFATKPDVGRGSHGIIMFLHLFTSFDESDTPIVRPDSLRLLCGYESGSVILRRYTRTDRPTSIEGQGWEVIWAAKSHVETIMAMAVSRDRTFALSVSADHLVVKYDLTSPEPNETVHRIKNPGNSSIAIRDDGKVCAVGGWDGSIRLYSTKSFKPLGTLKYHKANCQCLAFAHAAVNEGTTEEGDDDESDDELTASDKAARSQWLLAGSKDNRVSIWTLISFESASSHS